MFGYVTFTMKCYILSQIFYKNRLTVNQKSLKEECNFYNTAIRQSAGMPEENKTILALVS